jgi:hypothetical protein
MSQPPSEDETEADAEHAESDTSVDEELRGQLQQALEALQDVNREL